MRREVPSQVDRGSNTTRRGGELGWGTTAAGGAVVRGTTAQGYSYAGRQAPGGARAGVVRTDRGDVVVRNRAGGTTAYRKAGADWREVHYHGHAYYTHRHRWYWPTYYGGHVYYQEVYPPAGMEIDNVPADAAQVIINGREYVFWDGVYYEKVADGYRITDRPGKASSDQDPVAILRAMNTFLAQQKTFVVLTRERVARPVEGRGFQSVTVHPEFAVARPDKLAARRREGAAYRQFWYDGKTATLFDRDKSVYGQVEFSGPLSEMLDMLALKYGMVLPLTGMFEVGFVNRLEPRLTDASYVGREKVDGRECHRVSLQTDDAEGDLWIDADDKAPVLRKIVLRYPTANGNPDYQATLTKWRIGRTFAEGSFGFSAPEGAKRITMLPVVPEEGKGEMTGDRRKSQP